MKKVKILKVLVLLLILSACGNSEIEPSQQEILQQLLESTWTAPAEGAVIVDGVDRTLNFVGLTLTVNGSNYSWSNAGDLFRSSGTWRWADTETIEEIILDDGKELNIVSLTENEVVFTFFYSEGGVRAGIEGNYTVTLVR